MTKEFNINHEILYLLSKGYKQGEIHKDLKQRGINPNSVRTIEDKLREMKKEFKCKTVFQLMYKVGRSKIV